MASNIKIEISSDESSSSSSSANGIGKGSSRGSATIAATTTTTTTAPLVRSYSPTTKTQETTTRSSFENENENDDVAVDPDDLQKLSAKNASKTKYPPGCPVWHYLGNSSPRRLDARRGVVEAVYVDLDTGARYYELFATIDDHDVCDDEDGGPSVGNEEGSCSRRREKKSLLRQDELAYAMNCPVSVSTGDDHDGDHDHDCVDHDGPGRRRRVSEGTIVCPRTARGDRKLSYSVLFAEGDRVWVELGVGTGRVSFRRSERSTTDERRAGITVSRRRRKGGEAQDAGPPSVAAEGRDRNDDYTVPGAAALAGGGDGETNAADNALHNGMIGDGTLSNNTNEASSPEEKAVASVRARETNDGRERGGARPGGDSPGSNAKRRSAGTTTTNEGDGETAGSSPGGAGRDVEADKPSPAGGAPTAAATSGRSAELKQEDGGRVRGSAAASNLPRPSTTKTPSKAASSPGAGSGRALTSARPSAAGGERYLRLTIPSWVTDYGSTGNVFHHIIGICGEDKGFKTRVIARETGCAVDISHQGTPMHLTITPLSSWRQSGRFNLAKAREMLEDSLLEFVECEGAKARLLYELALSLEGDSGLRHMDDGIVQQRGHFSNDLVWMKLLELPPALFLRDGFLRFKDGVRHRVQHSGARCSVEVFGHGLGNMKIPARFCKPFALICVSAKADGYVETARSSRLLKDASKVIYDAVDEYRPPGPRNSGADPNDESMARPWGSIPPPTLGKRNSPSDAGSLSSLDVSLEHPRKKHHPIEVMCVLTVPLWVLHGSDSNLFRHLLGANAIKHKEMVSKTNCKINFSKCSSKNKEPMIITITSNISSQKSFEDVRLAKNLIEGSLIEFMNDENSEGRLVYELAMTATGSYKFRKARSAVQQMSHIAPHQPVWMQLLELPSGDFGRYLLKHEQMRWIKGAANCNVGVYSFNYSLPVLSSPYVLVFGNSPNLVNEVAARVGVKIDEYRHKCR